MRIPPAASLLLLIANAAQAFSNCPRFDQTTGNTRAQSISTRNGCIVFVSPDDHGDVYRSYSFSSSGQFMIFDSFGAGGDRANTGARSYFIFPRKRDPKVTAVTGAGVEVELASGNHVWISAATSQLAKTEGITFEEDPEVRRDNAGGVEIKTADTLVLDCGFQMGGAPYSNPAASSVFRDSQGSTCVVSNSELFEYGGGTIQFKFATDDKLQWFLAQRCPVLRWGWIAPYQM